MQQRTSRRPCGEYSAVLSNVVGKPVAKSSKRRNKQTPTTINTPTDNQCRWSSQTSPPGSKARYQSTRTYLARFDLTFRCSALYRFIEWEREHGRWRCLLERLPLIDQCKTHGRLSKGTYHMGLEKKVAPSFFSN